MPKRYPAFMTVADETDQKKKIKVNLMHAQVFLFHARGKLCKDMASLLGYAKKYMEHRIDEVHELSGRGGAGLAVAWAMEKKILMIYKGKVELKRSALRKFKNYMPLTKQNFERWLADERERRKKVKLKKKRMKKLSVSFGK